MTPSETELSSLLTDVRKSYRLLHDYQRLVLDSVKYIGNQLDMNFRGGWCKFCDGQPRNGRAFSLDSWAWDWLGMYAYDFCFELSHGNHRGIEIPENSSVLVAATILSDTGYYEKEKAKANPDKTRVETFKSAEASKSKVIFTLFRLPGKSLGHLFETEAFYQLLQEGQDWPDTLTAEGIFGFVEDVSVLFGQERADHLVDRITTLAAAKGLPIYKTGQAPEEQKELESEKPS